MDAQIDNKDVSMSPSTLDIINKMIDFSKDIKLLTEELEEHIQKYLIKEKLKKGEKK